MAFLHGTCKRREGNAEANQLVVGVPINDTCHQVQVSFLDVGIHQLVNLVFAQLRVSVQVFVGIVDEVEDIASHSFLHQFMTGKLAWMQVVALLNHL